MTFLVLSKLLDLCLAPLSWSLALALLALVVRSRKAQQALLGVSLAITLFFASEPVSNGLARLAEGAAPKTYKPGIEYDAVVILGGALDPEASKASGHLEWNAAVERVLQGYELLRLHAARYALLSGGLLDKESGVPPEAQSMKEQLQAFGISEERLVLETQSRNTHENAVESAKVAAAHRWRRLLLVTSAAHMPRALGCFRAAGLDVDSYPVDYRASYSPQRLNGWLPRAGSLSQSTDMLRELAGRFIYELEGYSK